MTYGRQAFPSHLSTNGKPGGEGAIQSFRDVETLSLWILHRFFPLFQSQTTLHHIDAARGSFDCPREICIGIRASSPVTMTTAVFVVSHLLYYTSRKAPGGLS
ncbi:hypothetical protein JOQ06_016155, partial [Pogonophryne albipinna]